MKRRVREEPAPLLLLLWLHGDDGVRRTTYRSPFYDGCTCLLPLLCFFFFLGCHAGHPLRSLLDDSKAKLNITVKADNVCLRDAVQAGTFNYYALDISGCFDDPTNSYLAVEARIYPADPGCEKCKEWSMLVNTKGELPTYEDLSDADSETFLDFVDSEHLRQYMRLDLALGLNQSDSWVVGIHSSSSEVNYTLKAWCSVSKGCNLSCSDPDSGPCVSQETCRCIREKHQETCKIDVDQIPDEDDSVARNGLSFFHDNEVLEYGEWKYFQFEVVNNESRTLVQLARASGDVILYVKPYDGEDEASSLPIEGDTQFSDLASFQNRLSHHNVFVNGAGTFYVGVYNMDHCVKENTTFNLTITTAIPEDPMNLCPLNCSYPQGVCVRDNACECEPGYGGNFCAGSLWPAAPRKSYSGQLLPGEWAYVNLMASELKDSGNVSVKFTSIGGHCILMAQRSGYPTLKDYYLKFSDERLTATISDTYHINRDSLDDGNVILAVFNVDYDQQGVSNFEIAILGAIKGLSIWIILSVALGSSVVVLFAVGTFRYVMQERGLDGMDSDGLDFEATPHDTEMVEMRPLDRVVVSTFPLLAYQEGLFSKEEARCAICLNNYHIAEILCRIPACKHAFHVKCIDEWFQKDPSCPLCRGSLQDIQLSRRSLGATGAPRWWPPKPTSSSGAGDNKLVVEGSTSGDDMSSSHSQDEFPQDNPAPLTAKDYQPLLVKKDSTSLGSSSRSAESECTSLSVQRPQKSAAKVSMPQFRQHPGTTSLDLQRVHQHF